MERKLAFPLTGQNLDTAKNDKEINTVLQTENVVDMTAREYSEGTVCRSRSSAIVFLVKEEVARDIMKLMLIENRKQEKQIWRHVAIRTCILRFQESFRTQPPEVDESQHVLFAGFLPSFHW